MYNLYALIGWWFVYSVLCTVRKLFFVKIFVYSVDAFYPIVSHSVTASLCDGRSLDGWFHALKYKA